MTRQHAWMATAALCCVLGGCGSAPSKPLVASAPVERDALCRRISRKGKVQTYCGSAVQWESFMADSALRCVIQRSGSRDQELCATDQEWQWLARRTRLRQATEGAAMSGMSSGTQ